MEEEAREQFAEGVPSAASGPISLGPVNPSAATGAQTYKM